jgi:hypothetical protein
VISSDFATPVTSRLEGFDSARERTSNTTATDR